VLAGAAELFDPEDWKAGAASMMRVLKDVHLQRDLSAKGRDQARRFSWAATAQKTLQAYEELARRG
jgi:glycosyltransferase involved in cell wall biosynthesis